MDFDDYASMDFRLTIEPVFLAILGYPQIHEDHGKLWIVTPAIDPLMLNNDALPGETQILITREQADLIATFPHTKDKPYRVTIIRNETPDILAAHSDLIGYKLESITPL